MIKNDSQAPSCTCPSGDGSLRHPCPAHPAVDQEDVAAKLTFINGRPAMCGCQVEYSDGGGEYSDVIYVTLCAKHSGSAILDLVATNRIALTPEYEGQWHADLYLDREIPLAKVEGATPAEAVLALMSAERIDPEQESVEQAGGDERAGLRAAAKWHRGQRNAFEAEAEMHRQRYENTNRPDSLTAEAEHHRRLWETASAMAANHLDYAAGFEEMARAALALHSPVRSSLLINGYQLRAALDFIAPDGTAEQLESEACIEWRQQDADFLEAGLYAFCAEYPEEGGVLLDEEPTNSQPSPALPPFADKVLAKLRRFYDCASDFESGGVDIGRHWLDLLTQLGLLNRVQRSPALWEISQQGEDLLGMPQPSPAQELAERGTQHRFSTTEQTCRHDFYGVWWNDSGVTKTGRECRHCGFFVADMTEAAAEQAEAERPEVVAYFDRNYPSTGDAFIWANYEGSPYEPVMTVAQHERIVGELRAESAKLSEALDECDGDRWKLRSERDAANARLHEVATACATAEQQRDAVLARVAELETALEPFAAVADAYDDSEDDDHEPYTDMGCDDRLRLTLGQHRAGRIALEGRTPQAQAQHSVPEGWKLVPVEPTEDVLEAIHNGGYVGDDQELRWFYQSILAAAPAPGGE
ncbi:hypothetical protein ACP0JX_30520 [Pseudomonas aeruginosa]